MIFLLKIIQGQNTDNAISLLCLKFAVLTLFFCLFPFFIYMYIAGSQNENAGTGTIQGTMEEKSRGIKSSKGQGLFCIVLTL